MERFWASVKKSDGCWLWMKSCGSHGYGQFYLTRGKPLATHRVAWETHYGPIPSGSQVLHRCDTKRCVRPDHLFLGTQLDNMRDMCAKGRHARVAVRGDDNPNTKVTDIQVGEIRRRFIAGTRQNPGNASLLSVEFGITRTRVYQLAKRIAR